MHGRGRGQRSSVARRECKRREASSSVPDSISAKSLKITGLLSSTLSVCDPPFQDLTKWRNHRWSTKSDHRRKLRDREHVINQMTNGAHANAEKTEAVPLERCSCDSLL